MAASTTMHTDHLIRDAKHIVHYCERCEATRRFRFLYVQRSPRGDWESYTCVDCGSIKTFVVS